MLKWSYATELKLTAVSASVLTEPVGAISIEVTFVVLSSIFGRFSEVRDSLDENDACACPVLAVPIIIHVC